MVGLKSSDSGSMMPDGGDFSVQSTFKSFHAQVHRQDSSHVVLWLDGSSGFVHSATPSHAGHSAECSHRVHQHLSTGCVSRPQSLATGPVLVVVTSESAHDTISYTCCSHLEARARNHLMHP